LKAGIVRVYGVLPRIYNNMIRASYVAGYPVDWANAGDHNTHWLPADLTSTAENVIVRRFTRRQLAGKSAQSLEGANITWRNELDAEDPEAAYMAMARHMARYFGGSKSDAFRVWADWEEAGGQVVYCNTFTLIGATPELLPHPVGGGSTGDG